MDGVIGTIILFAGNFAPRGWAFCDGQLLAINSNSALFSILGTTYGGDGRTSFGLPDLQGRVPVGEGQGAGLTNHRLGQRSGSETFVISQQQLPSHGHTLASGTVSIPVSEEDADQTEAAGKYLANGQFYHNAADGIYGAGAIPLAGNTGNAGNSQPVRHTPPGLGMNYIICLLGIFPSRS